MKNWEEIYRIVEKDKQNRIILYLTIALMVVLFIHLSVLRLIRGHL